MSDAAASMGNACRSRIASLTSACVLALTLAYLPVEQADASPSVDPHYTSAGFFDIHLCNWPDQPLFLMTLFSSERYTEIASVEVFDPDGRPVGALDPTKFRELKRKGKPDKRVFISELAVPQNAPDGWYSARVTLRDGSQVTAKDYLILVPLDRPSGLSPADGAQVETSRPVLSWQPVTGARFYEVYIRDLWDGEKLIHHSKLIAEPRYAVPAGVLKPGGFYSWKVHARDVNEHVLLGDFNHGSQSEWIELEIAEP
jgi:hypothetical protein